jgi:CDP-diacylglycerol--serine O-phosphatidyltransferase
MADKILDTTSDEIQARRMRRRFRKGVFVLPSLLTTANIFCGFYSVMESLAGVRWLSLGDVGAATEHFDRAAINIGFSWLFDFLDGRVARLTGATSEFGIELDSIADVLSFGIAPALLVYTWGYGQYSHLHKVGWAASFLYLICGALRLARFNVQARQPKPNLPPKNPKIDKKSFVGMPIPAGAGLIAAVVHFAPTPMAYKPAHRIPALGPVVIDGQVYAVVLLVLVACLGFLMVSTIRYSSFKNAGAGNYHPRVLILMMALLVLAIWFYSQWSLLILSVIYVSHGVVGKLWAMIRPRRPVAEHTELELDSEPQG